MKQQNKEKWIVFIVLQIALFIVSLGGICSKMAGKQKFLSISFFFFYGLLLLILFGYAIIWQQVLKKISLTVAYASKGIGIIYSTLWGVLFFNEKITWNMIMGTIFVLIGVYCYIIEEIRGL